MLTGQWDIWNEADLGGFWPFQDDAGRDRFFETWRRAYLKIREQLPHVQIAGPSLTPKRVPGTRVIRYDNFLEYAARHEVLPTF